mmetsp:Transcript_26915/g.52761  ORF Transcript_26915/g.52761 Transcript_26915/m.52761 type:complete len:369 (+) Transcript_26915:70-1176(+)
MGCGAELEKWTRGEYVEVFGLQSPAGRQLNRQKGIVIKADDETGRIQVCLGPQAKMASLKPECLRSVPEATAEEIQDAKDVAGPALRAEQESEAQPGHDISTSTSTPGLPERERSRSWSPPPEAVRAASLAGQQASSAAIARGLSSEQAEALGAAAAEQFLARAERETHVQKQRGPQHASMGNPVKASSASGSNGAPAPEKKTPSSLEFLNVSDTVRVIGLKGTHEELNGERFTIENFKGFGGPRNRKYVVSTTRFIIDAQGDPAEEKVVLTIAAKNIRLPGDESEFIDSSEESSSSKRTRKKRTSKRSRSRRRARRGRSSSSSNTSSKSAKHVKAAVRGRDSTPAAVLSKAQRLQKFGFLTQQQQQR